MNGFDLGLRGGSDKICLDAAYTKCTNTDMSLYLVDYIFSAQNIYMHNYTADGGVALQLSKPTDFIP